MARYLRCQFPPTDCAWHGEGSGTTTRWEGVGATASLIPSRCRKSSGLPTGGDADQITARVMNQPEAVAANPVHMRIDHRNHAGGGHHRFHCSTALVKNTATHIGGLTMRRRHDSAKVQCRVEHCSSSVRPFMRAIGMSCGRRSRRQAVLFAGSVSRPTACVSERSRRTSRPLSG